MAKLLTVEDETAIRELLAFICETDGHEVVKAASLAEAREALRRGGLDLILLDVMLPDGSGFDFLREVRAAKKVPGQDRIYTAGEKEHDVRMQRKDTGVPINESVQAEMSAVRDKLGLTQYVFPWEK